MRHFILIILVFGLAVMSASAEDHKLWVSSWLPPASIPAAKAKLVHDGITLQQLVEACGPGWCTPGEGAGVLRWVFDDGQQLSVYPAAYTEAEVITFGGSGGRARMWWQRSGVSSIHTP